MILVTGASGSGKSFTISQIVARSPDVVHVQASRLLHNLGRPLRPLTTADALENQVMLVKELERLGYLQRPRVVLDGHVILETTDGPLPLPSRIFNQLRLEAIAVVDEAAEAVTARRAAKGLPWGRDDALRYQTGEKALAQREARRLGVPYRELRSGDAEGLARLIDEVSRDSR